MDLYQPYTARNHGLALVPEPGDRAGGLAPWSGHPRIAVYTGGGSSHSWLWLVEIFERLGFWDLVFADEIDVARGALDQVQVLAVSGGDTFGMARALGPRGAAGLESFLRAGGLYLGSCAGAYLPLNSSKEPLNLFNWVPAKITNLSRHLPRARQMPQKFCTPYGCSYVFHPVREETVLEPTGLAPFGVGQSLRAPLYGGPAMIASGEVEVLATYQGFSERTRFLVDPELARQTLLGRAAVIRSRLGRGCLYLFGPHFEHPGYAEANRLVAEAIYHDLARTGWPGRQAAAAEVPRPLEPGVLRDLRRQVSNARVVALGLEDHPARWRIGRKLYEPAKFRVFCEALWQRLRSRRGALPLAGDPEAVEALTAAWRAIAEGLRALKRELALEQDTQARAEALFSAINRATADFMDIYFRNAYRRLTAPAPFRPDPAPGRRLPTGDRQRRQA